MLGIEMHIQEEVESLKEGEVREREPARSPQQQQGQSQQQRSGRQYGQQAFGQGLRSQVLTVSCRGSLSTCSCHGLGCVHSVESGMLTASNLLCTCSSRLRDRAQRVARTPRQKRTHLRAPGRSCIWRTMMHLWSAVTSGYVQFASCTLPHNKQM